MPVAKETLRTIREYPRLTPEEIAIAVNRSIPHIRNVLSVLENLGLVARPVTKKGKEIRGLYLITELGEYVLRTNSL